MNIPGWDRISIPDAFTWCHRTVVFKARKIYTEQYPGEYRYLDMDLIRSQLGVAFRKGENEELAAQLTQTLQEMTEDGTTAQILEKYGLDVEQNLYGDTE